MPSSHDQALAGATVCVVGINYAPESTGIAPYTTALATALRDGGADVRVVTGVPHYPHWRLLDERYRHGTRWSETVDGIPVTRVRHAVPAVPDLRGRLPMEAHFLLRAARAVWTTPADAVIAVTPSLAGAAAAVTAARGRPLGVVVQDLTGAGAGQSGTTGGGVAAAIAAVEHRLLRRATRVGVITPRFGELLVQAGVPAERIAQVPNFSHVASVDATRQEARRRLGWPEAGVLAVHTGNMGQKQGLETVVEAARVADAQRSPVQFVLVGAGNDRARLEQLGRGVGSLRILDPVEDEDYPYVLAAADVLVLNERPGVREMSMPSKLTSYATARRPVVAAVEPGGITHGALVEAGAAELVDAGDAPGLLSAVERVVADETRTAELVDAARVMQEQRYGAPAAADRYRRFAADVLAAGPARRAAGPVRRGRPA